MERFTKKEERLIELVMKNLDKIQKIFDEESIGMMVSFGDVKGNVTTDQRNIWINGTRYSGIIDTDGYANYLCFSEVKEDGAGEKDVFKLIMPLKDRYTEEKFPKRSRKWYFACQKLKE